MHVSARITVFQAPMRAPPIAGQDIVPIPSFQIEFLQEESGSSLSSVSLVSGDVQKQFLERYGTWKGICNNLPEMARFLEAFLPKGKVQYVADMPSEVQKLIDSGVYRLIVDKNGDILPSVYGEKGFVKQVRLRANTIPVDLTSSLRQLETQAQLSRIYMQIQQIAESIKRLDIDLQNDRLALADAAWEMFCQAMTVRDSRMRETMLLQAIASATTAKRTLMRNFTENLKQVRTGHNKRMKLTRLQKASAASKAFEDLWAIGNMVRIEGEGYLTLGQEDAAKQLLSTYANFVSENALDDRDTLLMLNGAIDRNEKFSSEDIDRLEQNAMDAIA